MNTADRLRQLRIAKGWSQGEVAEKLGVSRTAYCKYESGENRPVRKLTELAELYDVSIDFLLAQDPIPAVKIPIYGRVAAGIPLEAIQMVEGFEEIPKTLADRGQYFALKISGQSMSPYILDGDIVVVRKQNTCVTDDVAIVLVNGEDATCKLVKLDESGITLIGYNSVVYPPHHYSPKEVEELPVKIIGKVVEIKRSLE